MNQYNDDEVKCEISIEDIGEVFFLTAFGSIVNDESAKIVINFCQQKKRWASFSREEISDHAKKVCKSKEPFYFHGLCNKEDPSNENNFIILCPDGRYRVTKKFIKNSFRYSPKV